MWEQIRANRIRSVVLVAAMGVLLLLLGYFLGMVFFESAIAGMVIALVLWTFMGLMAYFQGDAMILSVSGARKIRPKDNPRLYNVVEEMTIASGLPKIPDVYIIDDPTPNAFATGRDPKKASVAITSGLLEKLNRDELQGVIAHEISHIKNRDTLVMALCAVMLGTIVILAWYASRFLFLGGAGGGRRRSSEGSGGGGYVQIIILVLGIILMILAPILAQIIYFAVSRRREYLADASGALYTRYPEGLASALEKIGASTGQIKTANQAFAPMYISNPFRKDRMDISDIFGTHPPIKERIRILRGMGKTASLAAYDEAYRAVRKSHGGVVPATALKTAPALTVRAAAPAESEIDRLDRTRETSNMMWNVSGYSQVNCPCGTKLRVPPNFPGESITCPHCGRVHPVAHA